MELEQFVRELLPYIGGSPNVSRCILKKNVAHVIIKDRSLADISAIEEIHGASNVQLKRNEILIISDKLRREDDLMEKDYIAIAKEIIENVGGSDNVNEVFHCATRLRFRLKDESKADKTALENINGVMGTIVAGGMYQIIIGQDVELLYDRVCEIGKFKKEAAIDEAPDEKKEFSLKQIGNNILSYVVASMTPVVYPLLGAAIWNVIGMILGPDLLNVISTDSGFYLTTQIIYQGFFYFLPIYIGYTAARALKISNPVWGMVIGGIIIAPNFVSMVGTDVDFAVFSLVKVPVESYGQSLLPILLGVWVFSYLYKLLQKIIPSIVFGTVAPMIILSVMTIIMFTICAPLGTYIGEVISDIFVAMSNSILPVRILAFALLVGLWPVLTLCGMHLPIALPAMALMAGGNVDSFIMVCTNISLFYVYGMGLGAVLKHKNKEKKAVVVSAFVAGFVGGIVEPILYSVCIKTKSSIKVMLIGGAIIGIITGIVHPVWFNLGVANIFTFYVQYIGTTSNLIKGVCLTALSFGLGTAGELLFVKDVDGTELRNEEI